MQNFLRKTGFLFLCLLTAFTLFSANTFSANSHPVFLSGIVEGFYGRPWSHDERKEIIRFISSQGYNFYLYGPKDDFYHRSKWRLPYPETAFKKLVELIKLCKQQNIIFSFAVSPGLSIKYSSDKDFSLLCHKFEAVYRQGVRHFSLFLDDIPPQLLHPEDKKRFKTLGVAHSSLVNRLNQFLKQLDNGNQLLFVPTEYHGLKNTLYLSTIAHQIDKTIPICWTGNSIVSREISENDLITITGILKRKVFIWDNFPVNDYSTDKLFLAPITGRPANLKKYVSVYAANPMNQPESSKIPLMTIAAYLKSSENAPYHPWVEWENAIHRFSNGRAVPALLAFFRLFIKSRLLPDYSLSEEKVLDRFITENASAGSMEALNSLLDQYIRMETLLQASGNPHFIKEIAPWLSKLRHLAVAAQSAATLYKTNRYGFHYDNVLNTKKVYAKMPQSVGDFFLENFIERILIRFYRINRKKTPIIRTNIPLSPRYPISFLLDNDPNTYIHTLRAPKKGEFIEIEFPQIQTVKDMKLLSSASGLAYHYLRNAVIEYKSNSGGYLLLSHGNGKLVTIKLPRAVQVKILRIRFVKDGSHPLAFRQILPGP